MLNSVPKVVFGKEDLMTKKQITRFLIQNDIDFQPDENARGQFQAVIQIKGVNSDKKSTSVATSVKKQQQKLLSKEKTTEKKQQPSQRLIKIEQSLLKSDGVIQILKNNIEHLKQQNDLLGQYQTNQKNERLKQISEEIKFKIQSQDNIQHIYSYFKENVYNKHQQVIDYYLIQSRSQEYARFALSLFMVVLYYYYLTNEKDFIIDYHKILKKQEAIQMQFIELNEFVSLFQQIFFIQKNTNEEYEMNRTLFQGFIYTAQEKGRTYHNLTLFRISLLMAESNLFKSKLNRIMNQPQSQLTEQVSQENYKSNKTTKKTKQERDKISDNKSITKLSLTPNKGNDQSEKSTQTFRPKTLQNEAQTLETRIEDEKYAEKKQPIKELDNTFKKIFQDQLDKDSNKSVSNETNQFIRNLHVNKKYRDLSPKSFEYHYTEALKTLFLDKVDLLSSEELIAYYDSMIKKARTLYINYLKGQKKLKQS